MIAPYCQWNKIIFHYHQSITNVFYIPNEYPNTFGVSQIWRMNIWIFSKLLNFVEWLFKYIQGYWSMLNERSITLHKKYSHCLLCTDWHYVFLFVKDGWLLVVLKTFRFNETVHFGIDDENCQFHFFLVVIYCIAWLNKNEYMYRLCILCHNTCAHDICL